MAQAIVNRAEKVSFAASGSLATDAINHTTGNLIHVWINIQNVSTVTVTDTAGNTYNEIGSAANNGANFVHHFYAKNITGNTSNVITIHFTGASGYTVIGVYQASGCDTSSPLDAHSETNGSSSAISSATLTISGSAALIIAGIEGDSPAISGGSGYTLTTVTDGIGGFTADEYKVVSASETATANQNSALGWAIVAAAYKPVGGGITLNPTSGSLSLIGKTAILAIGIATSSANLSLVGNTPILLVGKVLSPSSGSLGLTGNTPSVKLTVATIGANLALVGNTPTINTGGGITISPTTGSLALIGNTPSLSKSTNLIPSSGSLSLSGHTPVLTFSGFRPISGSLSLTGHSPALLIETPTPGPTGITLTVPQIGAPDLTGSVITNNVLLYWTVPSSLWLIDHYIILRDEVQVGTVHGTFTIVSATIGGTHSYSVEAVDIVGNVGTESPLATLTTLDPIDFFNLYNQTAILTGTFNKSKNLTFANSNGVLGAVFIETWAEHFSNNSFGSITDAIAAGYDKYPEPTADIGYYEEIFDLGSLTLNATASALWSELELQGTVDISAQLAFSADNVTYTALADGPSLFNASFRYLKIRWIFTNLDDKSYSFIYNLKAKVDIQVTIDTGNSDAIASDSGGTTVTYNRSFKSINSITLTTQAGQPITALYQDVTNTDFKVLLFDSSGIRISLPFSWKAAGVI